MSSYANQFDPPDFSATVPPTVFDPFGNYDKGKSQDRVGPDPWAGAFVPGTTGVSPAAPPNLPGATLQTPTPGQPPTPLTGSSPSLSFGTTPTQQAGTAFTTSAQATGVGPEAGSVADYFARTVIVVLGFIFVAVGLHMLSPGVVPDVFKGFKK